jgi:uncharacterized membrane protein
MHRSTRALIWVNIVGIVLVTTILTSQGFGVKFLEVLPRKFYLIFHILGVVLFLGNIIITGFWAYLASTSKNREVINFSSRAINWADVVFTAPGVFLILATGLIASEKFPSRYAVSWLAASVALFSLSGLIWYGLLIPAQEKMIRLSAGSNLKNFYPVFKRWLYWGAAAIVLPLISLALMVTKPKLW